MAAAAGIGQDDGNEAKIGAVTNRRINADFRGDAADDETFELLDSVRDELAKIFIVSKAVLADKGTAFDDAAGAGLAVKVAAADGIKCERCWIYSDTVGESEAHPTLCRRCAEVMAELPPITE